MKKFLIVFSMMFLCMIGLFALKAQAAQLDISISSTDGSTGGALLDDDYRTTEKFDGGTEITLNSSEPIDSVYIKWDSIPTTWTMKDGSSQITCGENGFLHEFVQLSGSSNTATITIPSGGATIADVFAFSKGDLPDFVQKWEKPWDKADILFISTHSDDEVLFFGGMIPIYTNKDRARVQVAYFTDFFLTESYRNHELLDGIWTMGVDHYPQLGKFYDNYSESLEEAEAQFDHEECLDYITETIRRFKPQVVVTHDVNGEYGHGGHQYVSKLVREAVEITDDASQYPASANQYGTWDVPKTYLHLYQENPIEMDTRAPLEDFGGKCALDVAKEAYLKHGSQQWMWFYVDDGYDEAGNPDGYEYSCAKYGLFRTTVGADFTGNDVLDNITTYDSQKAEPDTSVTEPESASSPAPGQDQKKGSGNTLLIIIIVIVVIIIAIVVILLIMRSRQNRKREEMARRARARRAAQARRQQDYYRQQNGRPQTGRPQTGRSQNGRYQAARQEPSRNADQRRGGSGNRPANSERNSRSGSRRPGNGR